MHKKCLKQHFPSIKHLINVAIITLSREKFGFSKSFKNFHVYR